MGALHEYTDVFWRLTVVYMIIFAMFILNMLSFSAPVSTGVEISFILMAIYYWSIYRPTIIPSILVFSAGIAFDLLSGLPVGLSSFIFLCSRWVIVDQRLFLTGQPFAVIWLGFSLVSTIALISQWVLFGLLNLQWTPFQPVLMMILASVFIYPFISLILNLSHKILPRITDQYTAVS